MAYTKTSWKAGDKITSAKLNNIESGIENVVSEVSTLSGKVDESAIEQINGNVTAIANLRTDVDAAAVTANAAKSKADANEATISGVDTRVTTLENAGHVSKSQLSGLVAVDGVNVKSAQHKIVTTSDNKKKTAMIFNESDGGGCMFTDEVLNRKSFVGVNQGDAIQDGQLGQSVDIQIYCKDITTNVGSRMNFSPNGMFYTKGKNNGSYTADDEVMTRASVNNLLGGLIQRISDLESEVATIKANGTVPTE